MSDGATPLVVRRLAGAVPYAEGLRLQQEVHAARRAGTGPDTVLLLEHAPVVTLGPRTGDGDLRLDPAALAARGIEVHRTDRGGGVTFHGPGQLVAYPILDLRAWDLRPRDLLRFLEGLVIGVIARHGVTGRTVEGRTGVWVGEGDPAKVCAMGVRVAGGVSLHGLALNVATDLAGFDTIVPCGIRDAGVTSLHRLVDPAPTLDAVAEDVAESFRQAAADRLGPSPVSGERPA